LIAVPEPFDDKDAVIPVVAVLNDIPVFSDVVVLSVVVSAL
jgi:hypothetical protein